METIAEAKISLRENWEKGTDCPACGQLVKKYVRKLNSGMARGLIVAYRIDQEKGQDWFHISELLTKKIAAGANELQKLRFWKLVEQKTHNDDPDKKHSGFWRLTERGRLFVTNGVLVPRCITMYNQKFLGYEDENDLISIREALGSKFNYRELMGEYFQSNEPPQQQGLNL